MKPYYEDDAVTIYHGEWQDVLPHLRSFGVVLTSPPYNIGGSESAGSYFHNLADGYGDGFDDALPPYVYRQQQHELLLELWNDHLTDDGAIFYNHKPRAKGPETWLPLELVPPGVLLRQVIVWDRGSGFQRQRTHFVPTYEWVMLLAREAFRLATRSVDDVWRIPFETGSEHPAPFPIELARTAIGSTSALTVLDPFMGSGTTLRAAKDLGRRAVGIERSERYCEIAARRMAQEVLDLGGAA